LILYYDSIASLGMKLVGDNVAHEPRVYEPKLTIEAAGSSQGEETTQTSPFSNGTLISYRVLPNGD